MNTLSGAVQVTSMSLPLMAASRPVGLPGASTRVAADRAGPRALSGGVHGADPVLVLDVAVAAGVREVGVLAGH